MQRILLFMNTWNIIKHQYRAIHFRPNCNFWPYSFQPSGGIFRPSGFYFFGLLVSALCRGIFQWRLLMGLYLFGAFLFSVLRFRHYGGIFWHFQFYIFGAWIQTRPTIPRFIIGPQIFMIGFIDSTFKVP